MFFMRRVVELSNGVLTSDDCKEIIKNYDHYANKYLPERSAATAKAENELDKLLHELAGLAGRWEARQIPGKKAEIKALVKKLETKAYEAGRAAAQKESGQTVA